MPRFKTREKMISPSCLGEDTRRIIITRQKFAISGPSSGKEEITLCSLTNVLQKQVGLVENRWGNFTDSFVSYDHYAVPFCVIPFAVLVHFS